MDVKSEDAPTIGQVVVDVQIVFSATFSADNVAEELRSIERRASIEGAKKRLASMNGLDLVNALIQYRRATGVRLKM